MACSELLSTGVASLLSLAKRYVELPRQQLEVGSPDGRSEVAGTDQRCTRTEAAKVDSIMDEAHFPDLIFADLYLAAVLVRTVECDRSRPLKSEAEKASGCGMPSGPDHQERRRLGVPKVESWTGETGSETR